MIVEIPEERLGNQRITRTGPRTPAALVEWLGAVQAQEFPHARWALGLRMPAGTTDATVGRAFDAGHILRTHVLRPTWHFVTPADIRWMLELTGPRVQRAMASYNRRLELDGTLLTRAAGIIERALGDGRHLTRRELAADLTRAGMRLDTTRLAHVVMHAELERLICSGPRRGKQSTYALLAERAPGAVSLPRDAALAELANRYFRSHGPATVRDFVWWSGLTTGDATRALEMNRARQHVVGGLTYWSVGRTARGQRARSTLHLLPVYDEYLVAYRDRQAVPHPILPLARYGRSTVIFQHALVIDGHVAGTWRTPPPHGKPRIEVWPIERLAGAQRDALDEAAADYARFLNVPLSVSLN